ncbi:MAG: hypothetical protein FWF46_00135 [Oscillospiraceae bacterium]|nr:hypothetical protein [Oscillospiraceae bacterium]
MIKLLEDLPKVLEETGYNRKYTGEQNLRWVDSETKRTRGLGFTRNESHFILREFEPNNIYSSWPFSKDTTAEVNYTPLKVGINMRVMKKLPEDFTAYSNFLLKESKDIVGQLVIFKSNFERIFVGVENGEVKNELVKEKNDKSLQITDEDKELVQQLLQSNSNTIPTKSDFDFCAEQMEKTKNTPVHSGHEEL